MIKAQERKKKRLFEQLVPPGRMLFEKQKHRSSFTIKISVNRWWSNWKRIQFHSVQGSNLIGNFACPCVQTKRLCTHGCLYSTAAHILNVSQLHSKTIQSHQINENKFQSPSNLIYLEMQNCSSEFFGSPQNSSQSIGKYLISRMNINVNISTSL